MSRPNTPSTPEPHLDFSHPLDSFRPPTPIHSIDAEIVDTGESLKNRVHRKAEAISLRREAIKKYKNAKKFEKFFCEVCEVFLNSSASRKDHLNGNKHQATVARGSFCCEACNFSVKTQSELDRHLTGKKLHKVTLSKLRKKS